MSSLVNSSLWTSTRFHSGWPKQSSFRHAASTIFAE